LYNYFNNIITFLLILFSVYTNANTSDTTEVLFEKRKNELEILPFLEGQSLKLTITGEKSNIEYRPGRTLTLGASAYYKGFGGGAGISLLDDEGGRLGKEAKYWDFRFSFYTRRFATDMSFQWFEGFSIQELPPAVPDSAQNNIRPDLTLFHIGFNVYYGLSRKVSLRSIYSYNEMQLKGAGTFIAGLYQDYSMLRFSNTIFPDDISKDFKIIPSRNSGKFYSLIPTLGYQYNFIIKKVHFSPLISGGIGVLYQNYIEGANERVNGYGLAHKYYLHLPVGYNGEKLYYGAIFRLENTVDNLKGAIMRLELSSIKAFIGIRLK